VLLPSLPAQLRQACARPVELPDRALSQGEVEQLWTVDRAALVKCGVGQAALVAAYQALAAGLAAADRS